MRIRKLAPAGLAVGALALLLSFTPAQAATEINGHIEFGHPGVQNGVGQAYDHACEELKNEDGTSHYNGFDGAWIDLRDKGGPGTPFAIVMDQTIDIDVYFFSYVDQNEDGEMECVDTGVDPVAPGYFGEGGGGEVPAGGDFALIAGWGGTGNYTVKIG